MSYFNWLFGSGNSQLAPVIERSPNDVSVAVAESVTAGALSNALCSEPGASGYFKGGIVAYSIASKKDILNIDIAYAEKNNFANPFTTAEMARAAAKMLNARIGIATTGYSLPFERAESAECCAISVKIPYAYICLYDSYTGQEIIKKVEFTRYDPNANQTMQKASAQTKFAVEGISLYNKAVQQILKSTTTPDTTSHDITAANSKMADSKAAT